jgi:hypothetical protein
MSPGTLVLFVLVFIAGAFGYALIVRRLPGKQPGEDRFETMLAEFMEFARKAQERTERIAQAAIAAAAAKPAESDIAAATAALRLQQRVDSAASSTPSPQPDDPADDETPIQWAIRTTAVPAAELAAFANVAHGFPATTTYADILAAYYAGRAKAPAAPAPAPAPGTPTATA